MKKIYWIIGIIIVTIIGISLPYLIEDVWYDSGKYFLSTEAAKAHACKILIRDKNGCLNDNISTNSITHNTLWGACF